MHSAAFISIFVPPPYRYCINKSLRRESLLRYYYALVSTFSISLRACPSTLYISIIISLFYYYYYYASSHIHPILALTCDEPLDRLAIIRRCASPPKEGGDSLLLVRQYRSLRSGFPQAQAGEAQVGGGREGEMSTIIPLRTREYQLFFCDMSKKIASASDYCKGYIEEDESKHEHGRTFHHSKT